jgi:hypothetical protein
MVALFFSFFHIEEPLSVANKSDFPKKKKVVGKLFFSFPTILSEDRTVFSYVGVKKVSHVGRAKFQKRERDSACVRGW